MWLLRFLEFPVWDFSLFCFQFSKSVAPQIYWISRVALFCFLFWFSVFCFGKVWLLRFLGFPEWDFSRVVALCQGASFIVNPFEISKLEFSRKARSKNLKVTIFVAFSQQEMQKCLNRIKHTSIQNRPRKNLSNYF